MKKKRLFLVTAIMALWILGVMGVSAQALDAFGGKISVLQVGSSGTYAYFTIENDSAVQVQVCDKDSKLVANKLTNYTPLKITGLKKNKLYYYSCRNIRYDQAVGNYVATSGWASKKAFCTGKYSVSLQSSQSKKVVFKVPKIEGIKYYRCYMSTNEKSGYKRVATMYPGKKYVTSKFNGKTYSYGKKYYYKIYPVTTSGVVAEPYSSNFYIKKIYV
ncbi:MAG: hypothetical protein ACI4EI_02795 [Muricoprocola sp.]